MGQIDQYLIEGMKLNASDLHITVGVPPIVRVNGQLIPLQGFEPLTPEQTSSMLLEMLSSEQRIALEENGQVDFSYVIPKQGRFRANIYKQRRTYSGALRILAREVPTIDQYGLPATLKEFAMKPRGLVLITGPTGNGKSTTLAAMVNFINHNKRCHIITIEDPIEYLHRHINCVINQREVGDDTKSFSGALRSALREDPDVILVGEMRDLETISTAISAAETGHLVLSTLHTSGAAQTVDRIIDMFPPYSQQQVRVQLAAVLQGVVTEQLLVRADRKGRVPAFEILVVNDAVRNLIRENKCHQIGTTMQTGIKQGMVPMDYDLSRLVNNGVISMAEALAHCYDPETLKRYVTAGVSGQLEANHAQALQPGF